MRDDEMHEMPPETQKDRVTVLTREIEVARIILEQIVKLTAADDLNSAIDDMLAAVGTNLSAERMYIFEEKENLFSNTHEWRGTKPEVRVTQEFTREKLALWLRTLEKGGCVVVPDVEEIRETMPVVCASLKGQNIVRVVVAPIIMGSRLIGFLGADNAPEEITDLIAESLTSLGASLGALLQVRREQEKIKQQNRELRREQNQYRQALFNKSEFCYSFDVTEGLIYEPFTSAHGVNVIEQLGLSIPVSYDEMNEKYFSAFGVECVSERNEANLTCEGIMAQFEQGTTNIESEYYNPVTDVYYRVSKLLSRNEENDHVYAVVIGVNTTAARKKEAQQINELIEARDSLTAINEELLATLASEQEKTAIISALSNIYYAGYLIDMKDGSIRVASTVEYLEEYFVDGSPAQSAFERWIDNVLDQKYIEEARAFTDLSTLSDRMRDTKIITYDCISKMKGWIRVSFIEVDRDKNGDLTRVLWVGQHIDAAKQKELAQGEALKAAYDAANRANSAKSDFLANMSHDIRTPLNAIIGMTAIAGTHLEDRERVSDCLGKIATSSKHLLRLINEVLDMSKIESGKLDLHDEEFSLSELIDDLLEMVKPQMKAKGHELAVSVNNIQHEKVIGDGQRIQQVFMNLMSNSVKYTPEGGKIALTISEKPMNKPKLGCYEFIFEDNGIGMSEEFVAHMFEPFARASDSRVEKIQGTGLGMAIAKNMVQMMNGNIQVESQLNKGTKITVTVVMKLADAEDNILYDEFVDLPILVADDDEIACECTCGILEELGMKGEWVLSGREAVDVVAARHEEDKDFFAVIIDWKMPEMDGIMTTKEIRRRVGNDVPIIIISAYDWSDIEQEARAAGANAFISKPLFKSRVAHLFSDILGHGQETDNEISLGSVVKNDFSGKRALVVEDNELNLEIAGEILGMAGLEVDYARDGKEAVDVMSTAGDGYYDIVFMDIQMPVMNGYDATVAIRSLPGNYAKSVPIIAMTANAFNEDIRAALNAGMNQHMAKPLDFRQLVSTLHKWLD